MSTDDVLGYFSEYGPKFLEWIDDTSCKKVTISLLYFKRHFTTLSFSYSSIIALSFIGISQGNMIDLHPSTAVSNHMDCAP